MESTLVDTTSSDARAVRTTSPGHAAFAATMIALGAMGLVTGDFTQIWLPVPASLPARAALAYLCAAISLTCGVGLLWRRSGVAAARVLFAALLVWLAALRLPFLVFQKPLVLAAWSFGSTAVMVAAAWLLYARLAGEREGRGLGFVTDERGRRAATVLYGLSLIPFGLAHFMYVEPTMVLIPTWLPWPTAWAYFTGATFIAAGLAATFAVLARLAVSLSAVQIALFGLIVWVPRVLTGALNDFQRGEVITTFALTAGAWVVAESYRGGRWLTVRRRR